MIVRGLTEIKVKKETKQIKVDKKLLKVRDVNDPKLSPKRGYAWSD